MPIICPKCQHVRQPVETVPDWQCPACGVAYVKAADAIRSGYPAATSAAPSVGTSAPQADGIPWGKLILIAAVIWGGWTGIQVAKNRHNGSASIGASIGKDASTTELQTLAAAVKPGEVVMYSTTECVYCAQAKSWLHQYGFAFSECNMSVQPECEQEFKSFGATGTPYLIVRGHHMKDGFDSDEFVALLQK
jgi:glutaredoxin